MVSSFSPPCDEHRFDSIRVQFTRSHQPCTSFFLPVKLVLTLSTTDVPDARYGRSVYFCNKDVSLPYEFLLLQYVRPFPFHFSTLSVFDDHSSSQDGPPSCVASGANGNSAGPIPLKKMEVTVHTHSEQCADGSQYGLYISKDGQLYDKPHGLGIDGDIENGGSVGEK